MSSTTKRKTTRELASDANAAKQQQAIAEAKGHLRLLTSVRNTLRDARKSVLRSSVQALNGEIAYLIAESEAYRDAAAQLYTADTLTAPWEMDCVSTSNE